MAYKVLWATLFFDLPAKLWDNSVIVNFINCCGCSVKKLAAIIFICVSLMACGQTGELSLPEQDNAQQSS
jgi:hypothetical protein